LLAVTDRGICGLNFVDDGNRDQVLESLHRRWSQALVHEDADRTAPLVGSIFPLYGNTRPDLLRLYLNGTNFQIKVWEALLRIPPGKLVAYEDIARYLGMPQAARAVSRAVADNPIAVIIPCHRVVRKMGMIGGYRWGTARKQAILGWEMAKAEE
jgi:AraC family transcriptional regulator of adaptative response/methylated-DNA-[protein]-cysteine methyltransferase